MIRIVFMDDAPQITFTFLTLPERERIKDDIATHLGNQRCTSAGLSQPGTPIPGSPFTIPTTSPANTAALNEFKVRHQVLSKDKELSGLHESLVIKSQILDEEEFWQTKQVCTVLSSQTHCGQVAYLNGLACAEEDGTIEYTEKRLSSPKHVFVETNYTRRK
jgi:hypothetical protein